MRTQAGSIHAHNKLSSENSDMVPMRGCMRGWDTQDYTWWQCASRNLHIRTASVTHEIYLLWLWCGRNRYFDAQVRKGGSKHLERTELLQGATSKSYTSRRLALWFNETLTAKYGCRHPSHPFLCLGNQPVIECLRSLQARTAIMANRRWSHSLIPKIH